MTDLIERDYLIKKFEDTGQPALSEMGKGYDLGIKTALRVVKNAPAINRWIPCSERLPEVGIPVLIYDKHHKTFFVAKLDEDYFGFSSNMWHHPADVPCWMPLPEPPKEGESDA